MQITCMAYDVAEGSFLQARYLTKKRKSDKVKKYYDFTKHHQNVA